MKIEGWYVKKGIQELGGNCGVFDMQLSKTWSKMPD